MKPADNPHITRQYPLDLLRQPVRFPTATILPPVEQCSDDQLLALARSTLGGASDLLTSPSHVEALCSLLDRQDRALTQLSGERDTAVKQLSVAQGVGARSWEQWQETKLELSAELLESQRLRQLLAHRDTELAAAATLSLKFQGMALRITGRSLDDVMIDIEDENQALAEFEKPRARRFRPSRVRRPEEFDVSDTIVLDLPTPTGTP